ncbi:MAG: PAS domain S-box protein [Proteobacteria bacterium]|nr:PAS domain S-box protein [Pseudomonadota bacterium]
MQLEFEAEVSQVRSDLNTRIEGYAQTLRAAAALFLTADKVTREDWRNYVSGLKLERGYPAIQAIAFARAVADSDLEALIAGVRKDGVADFAMRPPGRRDRYVINVFAEPYTGPNVKALGYDMWQDADRRGTMQKALAAGEPMITHRTTLKVDEQSNPVPAFIMYMPVFQRPGGALYGYVLSPFRMPILMEDLLKRSRRSVSLSIHDGTDPRPENLFFSSDEEADRSKARFIHTEALIVGGQTWTLTYASLPDLETHAKPRRSAAVLAGGLLISVLLFSIAWSLGTTRNRAVRMAHDMTKSLRDSEARFRVLVDQAPDAIAVYDVDLGHFVEANPQAESLFGCTREELLKTGPEKYYAAEQFNGKSAADSVRELSESALAGNQVLFERTILNAQGRLLQCELRLVKLPSVEHRLIRGSYIDVTERKQQEEHTHLLMMEMETILRNALVGIVHLTRRHIVSCNHRFEELFGYESGELIGETTERLYDGHETFIGIGERAYADLAKNNSYSEELMLRRKDGSLFWGALTGCAIDPKYPDDGSIWIYADISERRKAELALEESRERFDLAVRGSSDGIWDWNIETGETYVSDRWCEMLGYLPGEVRFGSKGWSDWIHPDDRPGAIELMRQHLKSRNPYASEYRMPTKNGEYRWFLNRGQAIWNSQGRAIRIAGSTSDITERKQAEEKLRLAANVFTHAREGITITDSDGVIIDVNETFTNITGYSRDEVLGRNPRILKSGRQGSEFYAAMWHDLTKKGYWFGEIWNKRKNGDIYAEMLTISAVRDAHDNIQQYVALFSDITSLKEHEQQLEHIAHYDALTTLPNRVLMADRLQQAMAQAQRRGQPLAVAYLDLDGFKAINDNHGHEAGDQLLVAIAARMKQALREGDTLARLGGDEFVAVLLDLADVAASVPMLVRLLSAAAQPVQVGDLVLQVSASLGITFFPQGEDVDADQLLRQADQAMYQAKLAGKNRYHVFDAEQDRSVRGHHESLEHVRRALAGNEFVLYYQPKVNMRTGMVIGVEALIRWQHPERGLLSPATFLPVIEEHSLAVQVGEWVIDSALAQIEAWHAAGLNIPVSVNVGARQLQQADFVGRLRGILAQHPGVRPGDLEMEVLETSALEDLGRISQVIDSCRNIGVSFALDDFGTGYSSLTYLKRLKVALLKIDQSFVHDMLDDPDDLAILKGVLGLSSAFHLQAIAEGVETVEHGTLLLQLGCELGQGYGIARPMPAHEVVAWSAVWHPDPAWRGLHSVNQDDIPLLFASVEHRAWVRAIEEHVKDEREIPPPLDHGQCRLGMWLRADGGMRYGLQPAFLAIEPLHSRIHEIAAELCQLHDMGQKAEVVTRLGQLHGTRDALLQQLKALEKAIQREDRPNALDT